MSLYIIADMHAINMNAIAAEGVIGFPAITGFAGFTDALRRQLVEVYPDIKFDGFAVSSKQFDLHALDVTPWEKVLCGKRKPLKANGGTMAFKPEATARGHITVAIKFSGVNNSETLEEFINDAVARLRLCGGDIFHHSVSIIDTIASGEKSVLHKLMPGYAVVSRTDLIQEKQDEGMSGIDALLHYVSKFEKYDEEQKKWVAQPRDKPGWLVPLVVGYQGLTEPAKSELSRDNKREHLFAEPLMTLGEFKMPCNFNAVDDLLWRTDKKDKLYVCTQGE